MPRGPVPEQYLDILASDTHGHLATLDATGRPQVNPVWFLWDGTHLLISVKAETAKYRNMRRDPRVAVSILDMVQPNRYLEIRGEAIDFERYDDFTFVNQVARKYTGKDYDRGPAGEERYKVTIRVDSWTAQDG